MIDFHSHILPKIDDGSKNTTESLKMLRMLKEQGVSKVIATPHFSANRNTVDEFLTKRETSFNSLSSKLHYDLPEVLLGAEVKFYEGISRLEGIEKLCIGNSKLLLLEMPMRKWTEYILKELREISNKNNVIIVIAHVERYLSMQNKDILEELVSSGALIQANADYFINIFTRRKAINLLKYNLIHFIGSDCHNLESRAPRINEATSYIRRKAGEDLLVQMNSFAERFI